MSTQRDSGSFDPYTAPANDDLMGRAIRLSTAAAVVSMLLANPPGPLLHENLKEGAMADRWPLRDARSLAGATELALATYETVETQTADWHRLIGPGSATPPVLSILVPDAPVPPPEATTVVPSPRHLAPLPPDHVAVVLARSGSLAARAAAPNSPEAAVIAFTATSRTALLPLAPAVGQVLADRARTHVYRALTDLLAGITSEAVLLSGELESRDATV